MPLFIDIHDPIDGAAPGDIADAHRADLDVAWRYGVHMRGYSFSPGSRRLVCLMEAPDAECVRAMHRASHGLVAELICKVIEDGEPQAAAGSETTGRSS